MERQSYRNRTPISVPGSTHSLQWCHNGHDCVSNHQTYDCLFNRLFRRRSKKTSKLRVTGLCEGNSPVTVEFPTQMASNAENVSIWWRHHVLQKYFKMPNFISFTVYWPLNMMTYYTFPFPQVLQPDSEWQEAHNMEITALSDWIGYISLTQFIM